MSKNILVVGADFHLAGKLKLIIVDLGFHYLGTIHDAGTNLDKEFVQKADTIIADLDDSISLEIVKEILEFKPVPILYMATRVNNSQMSEVIRTNPAGFVMKPFKKIEMAMNIDIASQSPLSGSSKTAEVNIEKDEFFIPDNQMHLKICSDDIIAVVADGAYIEIITTDGNYKLSSNLKNFIKQFKNSDFIRVSRKYLINKKKVSKINGNTIYLGHHEFQFPKASRGDILNHFKIIRTQ